tara:strand:- start:884 stop:1750 length:867 start_codon:yes stop_codon:yes gene_type:complete
MSTIFQDTTDIYADSTWEASPWRNYIRKPTDAIKIPLNFATNDLNYLLWVTEEEYIGKKVGIWLSTGTPDYIGRVSLYDADDSEMSRSVDGMKLSGGYGEPSINKAENKSWIMPGVGFQWLGNIHALNSITSAENNIYTITSDNIPGKTFDGGVHCWIKLDTVSAGIATAMYSENIPSEFLHNQDSVLIFNSLGNIHSYATASNRAFTFNLLGSVDGTNWDTLGTILDDVDIRDQTQFGTGLQYPHILSGTSFQKYPYYKFRWYVVDGTGTEAPACKQNFIKLSLYKI